MLASGNISQIPVDNPLVYAFYISGEVNAESLAAMGETMNDAFDSHPSVSMLLIFEQFEGLELGAGFDTETLKSQFRSLAKVDKYAVVGAPSVASNMISVMDKVIPTDARTFKRTEEEAAWEFVAAKPLHDQRSVLLAARLRS